ncbi:hypothetical protein MCAP1_002563 [Malassezia caprae]|uniref:triacylglycerol lipase n=1 Tax=Malassezia caprae TaxID=1381934 RepID=A0AAF0IW03_9BASI|nr:hypothetical protein MCAP1_002563 [Malassezia caprae]
MYSASLLRWLALAVIAMVPLVSALGKVPYPDQDPFYYPPDGWKNKAPGDILRSRKIQAASVGILKFNIDAWQMLYRTNTINRDTPSYTVTTALVPHNADHSRVVTFSAPENANSIRCAPSYTFRNTGVLEIANFEPRWEQMIYTVFLEDGFIVNAPDHEGPGSLFSAGRAGGHAVLDSMRAVERYSPLKISKHVKHIGHGYSGGSIPTGWAAGLHKVYAHELNVVGWSIGGTSSDPRMTFQFLDGSPTSALVLGGAVGLMDAYKDQLYDLLMNEVFTDEGKDAIHVIRNVCVYEAVIRFFGTQFQSPKYTKGGRNITDLPQAVKIMTENTMGQYPIYTPIAPVFMFHAAHDEELIWYQANITAVNWCTYGANIRFLTFTNDKLDHFLTYLSNVPNILFFMRDRFDGKPYYNGGCQFDADPSYPMFDPNMAGEHMREALLAIEDLLGKEIGPKDKIIRQKIKDRKNPNKDGLTKLKGMHRTSITPGEGGDNSKESKKASAKYAKLKKEGKALDATSGSN